MKSNTHDSNVSNRSSHPGEAEKKTPVENPLPTMPPPSLAPNPALSTLPKIVKFDALARCGDEIWIENEGQIYRLRKTKQGKLILTK